MQKYVFFILKNEILIVILPIKFDDMKKINPTIDLEKQIGTQIYEALQGSVVEEVLTKKSIL